MSGKNHFSSLHNHAQKQYQFKQSRSLVGVTEESFPGFSENLNKGVCLGLSAAWLSERLTHPHSFKNRALEALGIKKKADQPFKPSQKESAGDIHARNKQIVDTLGVPKQLVYLQKSKLQMLEENGLYERVVSNRGAMVPTREKDTHRPVIENFALAIHDACHAETLSPGTGAIISFTNHEDGKAVGKHVVAAYRSRGNNLHFFDANCGEYKVFQSQNFFETWKDAYKAAGNKDMVFKFDGDQPDEFTFLNKK